MLFVNFASLSFFDFLDEDEGDNQLSHVPSSFWLWPFLLLFFFFVRPPAGRTRPQLEGSGTAYAGKVPFSCFLTLWFEGLKV